MPKITAPLVLLQTALAAIKPYVSTDEVTPVITCVRLRPVEGGGITATATDRYQIGHVFVPSLTLDVEDGGDGMLLDQLVVSYIRGITKRQLLLPGSIADYTVTLEAPDPKRPVGPTAGEQIKQARLTVTLTNGDGEVEQMRSLLATLGHFPPVEKLLPDETWKPGLEGPVMLNPDFLANLSISARALIGRPRSAKPVQFEFFQPDGPASRVRPVSAVFDKEQYGKEVQLQVMLQPYVKPVR